MTLVLPLLEMRRWKIHGDHARPRLPRGNPFATTACSGTSPEVLILDAGAPADAVIIPHDAAPPLLDSTTPPDGALDGSSPPWLDAMAPADVGVGIDTGPSDAAVDARPAPRPSTPGPIAARF